MLDLLSLPNEILSDIIKTVHPDEIESFSLSCRLIHSLSKDVLREHAAKKQKYFKLNLALSGETLDNPIGIHPVFMLRDILQNDRVAFYPIELVIGVLDEDWYLEYLETINGEVSRTFAQYDAEIFSLLSKSPYLCSSEVARWHQAIGMGIHGATVAILLTILPNVEKITLHIKSFDESFLKEMMDRITGAICNLSLDVRRLTALSKVLDVTIVGEAMDHSLHPRDVGIFESFATLPSIKSINWLLFNGKAFRPKKDPGSILVPFSPSLREVRFINSSICPDVFRPFLCK